MTVHEIREPGPEPIATLHVRSATLPARRSPLRTSRPRSTSCRSSPCSACFAEGETVVTGAAELRAKESDRISGVVEGSPRWAPTSRRGPDGFVVRGRRRPAGREARRPRRSPPGDGRRDRRARLEGGGRGGRLRGRRGQLPALRARPAGATRLICWEGCPSPGHGESTSRSLESSTACTSCRSSGSKIARSPGPPAAHFPSGVLMLDLTVDHQHPGPLVHLVLLQLLALGQVDDDRAALGLRVQHLRLARLHRQLVEVPALHRHAALYIQPGTARTVVEGAP